MAIYAQALPSGVIQSFGARLAPAGWLNCDGSAVSRTTYASLFPAINPSLGTFTVTIAAPGVVSLTAHGLSTGDQVYLTTTGALPTGLTANTLYYAIRVDANSFNLATTRANAYVPTKITTSGTQSGTHTAWDCPYGLGDGSTTFTLPDLRGRVMAGMDTTAGTAASRLTLAGSQGVYGNIGANGGEQTHAQTLAEIAVHTHTQGNHSHPEGGNQNGSGYPKRLSGEGEWGTVLDSGATSSGWWDNPATSSASAGAIANAGSGTAFNVIQPIQLVNYIIKT